jgi:hypothetical protein
LRYNTEIQSFEGYGCNAWGSLGGVRSIDGSTKVTAENDSNVRIYTANTLRVLVDSVGNVGIGTDEPSMSLDVIGSASISNNLYVGGTINVLSLPYTTSIASLTQTPIIIGNSTATTIVDSSLQVNGNTVVAGTLTAHKIRIGTDNVVTSILGTVNTQLAISTQRLITTLSNITVENVTVFNKMTACNIEVQDTAIFNSNVYVNGQLLNVSDRNIKTNFVQISAPLEKISQLTGYTYTRTDLPEGSPRECGLLAQDVLKVLPEAVRIMHAKDGKDLMTVAYGNMVGLFVEAFKEMQDRITLLEAGTHTTP